MPLPRPAAGSLAAAALLCLPLLATAGPVDPADPAEKNRASDWSPPIAPASTEAETQLQTFTLPDGVTGSVWAAEPLLANPVAIDVDHRGRLFVAETWRQKKGVEDNREHMDWLRHDLAAQTVEDRLDYIKRFVPDYETEYGTAADLVRLVEDTDGDGTADESRVFAGGFDDVLDGTGAGVLARPDGTVYFTCIPDLYALKDLDGDGVAATPKERRSLSTGYGVRYTFRGHDMHGLTIGPDGRLYWSIGDRGFSVTAPEGTTLHMPDRGAVFRSEMDGTGLEVFASGMRNPQELAFDEAGNLFTWDNNSDSGDHARWVHVLRHADSGWRMYYQYQDDRGPWNREMTWFPSWWEPGDGTSSPPAEDRSGDPATAAGVPRGVAADEVRPASVFPPVAMIGDGPSGLAVDPGVGLPDELRGHFFACDFRGTPNQSGIRHWTNDRDGATFRIADAGRYVWGILATDATFHPDGSLFATDWVTGWEGVGKGRVYRFADEDHLSPTSAALLEMDYGHLDEPRLVAMLTNADRRVRQEAQLELAGRNAVDSLLAVAEDATADRVARRHALWGYGECVRRHGAAPATLVPFTQDQDPVLRWWAVRLLGELRQTGQQGQQGQTGSNPHAAAVTAALRDDDPRVVREAALAATEPAAAAWVREALARFPDDPAVFHAATVGLAETQSPGELAATLNATVASKPGLSSEEVAALNDRLHLAAVVALRRAGAVEQIARVVLRADELSPRVLLEAVRAAYDDRADPDALAAVAAIGEFGDGPTAGPLARRVLGANVLLGRKPHAERVLNYAAAADAPADLRAAAMAALAGWAKPDRVDAVTGRLRPPAEWAAASDANAVADEIESDEDGVARDASFLPVPMAQYATRLLDGPPEVKTAAVRLLAQYGVTSALPAVRQIAVDDSAQDKLRVAAVEAVDALGGQSVAVEVAERALTADTAVVRAAGRAVLVRRDPAGAVESLAAALETGEPVERQQAVATLARLATPEADAALKPYLDRLGAGEAPPEITLELLEAAANRADGGLGEYLAMYEDLRGPDKLDAWTESLVGGDAEAGAEIFFGRSAASCRRCHVAQGWGGNVGPVLDGIANTKDRRYLLEAIVNPDAKIAEGFATAVILTDDGALRTGVLREETDEAVTLVMPTGEEVVVPADTILDRTTGASAMPADIPDALTKREMRDLVEFLTTLTKTPDQVEEESRLATGGGGHEE